MRKDGWRKLWELSGHHSLAVGRDDFQIGKMERGEFSNDFSVWFLKSGDFVSTIFLQLFEYLSQIATLN